MGKVKTHCKRGHPLSGDNVYYNEKSGIRSCKTCAKIRCAAFYEKQKENPEFSKRKNREQRAKWKLDNPEKHKDRWLKRAYNISLGEYKELLEKQANKCAICLREATKPCVDHDHACCSGKSKACGNCVRGVLCYQCNQMLGSVRDSEEVLTRAINYLRFYRKSREPEK